MLEMHTSGAFRMASWRSYVFQIKNSFLMFKKMSMKVTRKIITGGDAETCHCQSGIAS